ncbi:MAG TPA: hypothetical protein PKC24_14955, partial [Cyclobacteriaceae bacterium]|nr:hypothetical protein [Cyclobacteriaceae bacterium]
INLNGITVEGDAYIAKTGAGTNDGNGGNVFNGNAEFVNSGSARFSSANSTADIFNGDVIFTSTGSSLISFARNSNGNVFNGDITFNSTLGSQGVYLGAEAGASVSLADGGSLLVGALGYSSGVLSLRRFTQVGADDQTLVLTGSGLLELGTLSLFNGNVDFRSPQFQLNGTIFNGPTYIEKTGAVNNDSNGGNRFNGPTTIVNSGTGFFRNGTSGLDEFNNTLTLVNTGSSSIRLADNVPGTVFNGDIIVSCTSGEGIFFGNRAGGTASLADGRTISVGGSGFTAGELQIRRFTQLGAASQTLNLTGSATLRVGANSVFNANVIFSAPRLFIDGATYHGNASITKTGAGNDTSLGGNTFNGITTIINSGSGHFLTANSSPDIFNAQLTVTNSGSNIIYLAHNVGGNQFNGNIILNATSGNGIYFSNNTTGNSTLASGNTVSIGGTGFSSGELRLRRFTQQGTSAQTLSLTGSAFLVLGPGTQFNGNITFTAPQLTLQTTTFNGTAAITKTGAGTNDSFGGNVFNGITTITNSGTARFRLANSNGDTFNSHVTFAQSGSGEMQPAFNGDSFFHANVNVNSTVAITFGASTGRANFTGSINQVIARTNVAAPVFRRLSINKPGGLLTLNTPISISIDATFTAGILETDLVNIPNFL